METIVADHKWKASIYMYMYTEYIELRSLDLLTKHKLRMMIRLQES